MSAATGRCCYNGSEYEVRAKDDGAINLAKHRRDWEAAEWQGHARRLVQRRHGAVNVQSVPDEVHGDCGIEFYALDGAAYQCYAPERHSAVQAAASGMKAKAGRDLRKLAKHSDKLVRIFGSTRIERWIFLCPFLDDKDVVAYVRTKGAEVPTWGLEFISERFEAVVQSLEDFEHESAALQAFPLLIAPPAGLTTTMLRQTPGSDLDAVLIDKLQRANPKDHAEQIARKKQPFVNAHARRESVLAKMSLEQPELWERAIVCINGEEQRLEATGAVGEVPIAMLHNSLDRIERILQNDVTGVAQATIQEISTGTIADWLMRCPLDFPRSASGAG